MKLLGEIYIYNFIDNMDINENKTDYIPQEFLQSQMPSRLPPSKFNLKVGTPIILFRNLYPALGECNGIQIIITQLGWRCIEACILGGKFHGQL